MIQHMDHQTPAPGSTRRTLQWTVLGAMLGVLPLAALAQTPQRPQTQKTGLAAVLKDDQKLMSELSRRQLKTLLEYTYKKNSVPEAQQKIYNTISSLTQLSEGSSTLSRRQQQELVASIAAGIDQVLAMITDSRKLLELSALMVKAGTVRPLNTLEYWGENTRTQSQLRPLAEAVDRIYDKAISIAQARSDELAKQFKDSTDPRVKEWEDLAQTVATARFNSAFNKYALALSIDKADPRRQKIAQAAIEIFTEYEDPQFEVQAQSRVAIAKLNMAIGGEKALDAARRKFAEVLADKSASWNLKFEAGYFAAVAELTARNVPAARQRMAGLGSWLTQNPPQSDDLKKGTEAAVMMLDYRILTVEAETSREAETTRKANEKAVAVLQSLIAKRPDLASIVNEQLVARLPENPAVKDLTPMLLRAMVSRGDDEIRKPENQPVDKKALTQALAAAQEIVARTGKPGVSADDADLCALEIGLFHSRLGQDVQAADAFLDYAEKHRTNAVRLQIAFDNSAAAVARLRRDQPDRESITEAYLRFLKLATAPPFNRREYASEYGRLLLERNVSRMQGTYDDAQRQQMLDAARRAAALFRSVTDEKRLLYARYFEMLAHNQTIDLLAADSGQIPQQIKQTQDVADEVNVILGREMAVAPDQAARDKLRSFRVRTALLAADLAKHDRSPQRDKSLERALALLANFEQDVAGMPNANNLLGEALFIRVNALMTLRRSDEALANLGRFLETRSGDDGLRIVYEMLENLNKEFQQAQQDKNEGRMAELAGHRARVSGYLVDRASKSTNPEVSKLLPRYRMFEAGALQQAALLEKDPGRRQGYLRDALAIFEAALKTAPDDKGIQFNIALVQYDLGSYAAAQPVLVRFLSEGYVGKPKVPVSGPEGDRLVDNNQYWDAMQRLLRCNVALAAAKAPGYDHARLMEETALKLTQLYIQWGQPGGPRWAGKFDALRQEVIPDWSPTTAGRSQPATTQSSGR